MAIPVDVFFSVTTVWEIQVGADRPTPEERFHPELRKRAQNALAKAMKVKPIVRKLLWLHDRRLKRYYYSIRGPKKNDNEYLVLLRNDRDFQWFIECSCPAGAPEVNEHTAVISWQPKPCYHAAAMLLQFIKTQPATEAKRVAREKKLRERAEVA